MSPRMLLAAGALLSFITAALTLTVLLVFLPGSSTPEPDDSVIIGPDVVLRHNRMPIPGKPRTLADPATVHFQPYTAGEVCAWTTVSTFDGAVIIDGVRVAQAFEHTWEVDIAIQEVQEGRIRKARATFTRAALTATTEDGAITSELPVQGRSYLTGLADGVLTVSQPDGTAIDDADELATVLDRVLPVLAPPLGSVLDGQTVNPGAPLDAAQPVVGAWFASVEGTQVDAASVAYDGIRPEQETEVLVFATTFQLVSPETASRLEGEWWLDAKTGRYVGGQQEGPSSSGIGDAELEGTMRTSDLVRCRPPKG